jgi:hypothetical protein
MPLKLTNVLTAIIAVILVLVPFHAFLTVWASSSFGHYTAWRLWDEVLLAVGALLGIVLCFYDKLWNDIKKIHVFWLIAAYALLQIILGVVAWVKHDVTSKALGYGLTVDIRFLLFFGLCVIVAARTSWLKNHWRQILLIPAALVVIFGLLQFFVLPYDFLRHFGYSASTIFPYETINHNLNYIRVMSTARGANPLGAYLVIVICALAALILKAKARRPRIVYSVLAFGSIITLFLTYSRSAWVGAALGVIIVIILSIKSAKTRYWLVATLAALAIITGGGALSLRHNVRFENIFTHTQAHSAVKTTSDQGHVSALKSGLRDVLHQPLGRGPGTAGPASIYNNQPARIAENYFVQIAQEVGWLGVVLLILIMWLAGKGLWLHRQNPLALALLAALIGITFVNLLSHAWVDDTLAYLWWGLAGIALAPALKKT